MMSYFFYCEYCTSRLEIGDTYLRELREFDPYPERFDSATLFSVYICESVFDDLHYLQG
jgi:hypothetical protein